MSGFVGILQRDGTPVDAVQLASLTDTLRFRGPEGAQTWRRGRVGFGHALFVTHPARDGTSLPLGLDGRFWITGHIRLDARDELIEALRHAERSEESREVSDPALVLRAYRTWGPASVTRLRGDFSVAIWDEPAQRLFCARDPFGVRPFFYAEFQDLLLFGNTLNTLRAHPRVSATLNELALADFMVCGQSLDADASFFRDIRRLPGGHSLTVTRGGAHVEKYWALPEDPPLRYRREAQYVEHFAEVLSQAVADRVGSGPVGISLSGGLDSGAIAAVATGNLGARPARVPLQSYTCGWNCAFEDFEPRFAQVSAAALQLPLELLEAPDYVPFRPYRSAAGPQPEPVDDFFHATGMSWLAAMADRVRINLDGQGGDEIFRQEWLLDEARRESPLRLGLAALVTWIKVRRPPLGLRARWSALRGGAGQHTLIAPDYLAQDWCRSLGLAQRLQVHATQPALPATSRRPSARARLTARVWAPYLESFDAGLSGVALNTSWPYLDHRVLRFALALPAFPWCSDKHIVRRALTGVLPMSITQRPKSPLPMSPFNRFIAEHPRWHESLDWAATTLAGRIDPRAWRDRWDQPPQRKSCWWAWELARPVALAHWLRAAGEPVTHRPRARQSSAVEFAESPAGGAR